LQLASPRSAGAPRQGGYVGGHVGGAWGDDTSASWAYFPGFASDIRLKRDIALVGHLDNLGVRLPTSAEWEREQQN